MSEITCWHEHCNHEGICLNCEARARINLPIPKRVHDSSETSTVGKQITDDLNPTSPARVPEEREKPKDWPAWACQKCWCNAGDDCRCTCHTPRPAPTPELDIRSFAIDWMNSVPDPFGCLKEARRVCGMNEVLTQFGEALRKALAHKGEQ